MPTLPTCPASPGALAALLLALPGCTTFDAAAATPDIADDTGDRRATEGSRLPGGSVSLGGELLGDGEASSPDRGWPGLVARCEHENRPCDMDDCLRASTRDLTCRWPASRDEVLREA
jgi:hypothetical protein